MGHGEEVKNNVDMPEFPMVFGRWEQSLVVEGAPVPVPPNEPGLDWEVELAVVIQDEAWGLTAADALDHVLGYTAFNDPLTRRANEDIDEPPARRAGWSHDWQTRWSHEAGRKPLRAVPRSWQATQDTNEPFWPGWWLHRCGAAGDRIRRRHRPRDPTREERRLWWG